MSKGHTSPEKRARAASRLAFFVTHSAAGGVQEVWADLAAALAARGHHTQRVALYPHRFGAPSTPTDPWHHIACERPRGMLQALSLLRQVVRWLGNERPNVVFTAMPLANVLLPLAVSLARVPARIVVSHHSPVQTYHPLMQFADQIAGLLPSTEVIVTVSRAVASSLDGRSSRYRAKVRTIGNALPPRVEETLAVLAASRVDRIPGRCIVAIGRLSPEKNYPLVLRAAQHLPDVEFRIVGSGPDEPMLRQLASDLGVEERVRFLGHLPREQAMACLAAADIFLQPSLFEGHSVALLEAATLGLPLVVSNVPSQIEGITRFDGQCCGITVDPSDDSNLALEIRRLLEDREHLALQASLARALARDASFDRMVHSYEAMLSPHGSAASLPGKSHDALK